MFLTETKAKNLFKFFTTPTLDLTKLTTPTEEDFFFYVLGQVLCLGSHLHLNYIQLSISVVRRKALDHRHQVDVLIVGAGDREGTMDAKMKRIPREPASPIGNPDGMNREGANRLRRGHPKVIHDQPNGGAKALVVIGLRLKIPRRLGESLQ